MVRGLYTSALGMITQMQRMDVVTHNLANADTVGYKKDQVAAQSFSGELMRRLNDPGIRLFGDMPIGKVSNGVFIDDIYTDFSNGALRKTDSPLDVAISGAGFFVVNVNGEERYTRDGSFTSFEGMLMTIDGGHVQGTNGDIQMPDGYITIDALGRILVNDLYVDTILVVDFTDKHTLRKEGNNYYRTTEDSQETDFTGVLAQGYLESANVNTVKEMVEMIALSRAYETNARMVALHDSTLSRAVNDIGRRA